jgi:hypothetical protein
LLSSINEKDLSIDQRSSSLNQIQQINLFKGGKSFQDDGKANDFYGEEEEYYAEDTSEEAKIKK